MTPHHISMNPRLLTVAAVSERPHPGLPRKIYRAKFGGYGRVQLSRRWFRTASEALAYADEIWARWVRLYDAMQRLAAT